VSPDGADTGTDVGPDSPGDTGGGDTTVTDTAGDTGTDTEEDTTEPDVLPDGATACELDGGYCTTYAIVAEPCVTCAAVGGVTYVPFHGPDGANECTAEGEGAGAWCCMPLDMDDLNDCETGGGTCVSSGGGTDRCPVGWVADTTGLACGGSHVCCVPGDSC
jgi:hypothetical protein